MRIGVYPGSFHPLTVAHVTIAEAALTQFGLERIDLAISRRTLGKGHLGTEVDDRLAHVRWALGDRRAIDVVVVEAELIVDIAEDYDVVVMGADKWAQVNDEAWYGGAAARDDALARLPRVAVAPRHGIQVPDDLGLDVPLHIAEISSTEVRRGRHDWAARPV